MGGRGVRVRWLGVVYGWDGWEWCTGGMGGSGVRVGWVGVVYGWDGWESGTGGMGGRGVRVGVVYGWDGWDGWECVHVCVHGKCMLGIQLQHVFLLDNGYTEPAKHYARYLGLGMRYEAGICTIVISMKRTFN